MSEPIPEFNYLSHDEITALSEPARHAYFQEEAAVRTVKNFQRFIEDCKKADVDTSKWKVYGSIGEMFDDMAREEGE